MRSVKTPEAAAGVRKRLDDVRRLVNPLGQKRLTWEDFAHFAGVPKGTAKNWYQRGQISYEAAVQLATRLRAAGYPCTAEWIRRGVGPAPSKNATDAPAAHSMERGGDLAHTEPPPLRRGTTRADIARPLSTIRPDSAPPAPTAEERALLAERASEALRKTLLKNEVYAGRYARELVADLLVELQHYFERHDVKPIYLGALYDALHAIAENEDQDRPGSPPNPPSPEPPGPDGSKT